VVDHGQRVHEGRTHVGVGRDVEHDLGPDGLQDAEDGAEVAQVALVHGDALARLAQVARAARAVPAGDAVDLHVRAVGHDVVGEVATAGPGHAGDERPHDFARIIATACAPVRQHTARAAKLDITGRASDPSPFETPLTAPTGAPEGTNEETWPWSAGRAGTGRARLLPSAVTPDGAVDPAALARLFRSLYRIRRVEEEVARVYPSDKIRSPVHLSIG